MLKRALKKLESLRKKQKNNEISKRQRLLTASLILGFTLMMSQTVPVQFRYPIIGFLIVLTTIFSIWSLKEDLSGVEFITLVTLPLLYSVAVGFTYFLLPGRWAIRFPVAVLYSTGMYIILLTENVYNVSAIRTIELIRAAHFSGLILTVITSLLLFNIIYSLHFPITLHALLIALVSFLLVLQNVWSIELEEKISSKVVLYTAILTLILVEVALALAFWPVMTTIGAIFLATVMFVSLGITQQYFMKRLNSKVLLEYLLDATVILIIFLFLTINRWRG